VTAGPTLARSTSFRRPVQEALADRCDPGVE
jgi:hypothetical protein